MKTVNINAARSQLSSLVEEAAAGNEIIIAKAGKARARLVPIAQTARKRKPGRLKNLFKMHDNFDDPLPPDIAAAFGMDE